MRAIQILLLSAALSAGCNSAGPAPEVPGLAAGVGGMSSGGGGTSGSAGEAGEGGHAGADSGGAGGAGGAGGVAGTGGVSGVGGMGGAGGMAGAAGMMAGTGGTGGATPGDSCTDSDALSTELPIDPSSLEVSQLLTKGTTVGINGRFEDTCTESGDLVEHVCQTQLTCSGGSQPFDGACAPSPQLTGHAIEVHTPCFGLCVDGACNVPCPELGTTLTVAQLDGLRVHLESDEGIVYACVREACLAFPPDVGDTLAVDAAPVPNETQLDCHLEFATTDAPLVLSDGCSYTACVVQAPQ